MDEAAMEKLPADILDRKTTAFEAEMSVKTVSIPCVRIDGK